ncbi:TetR/AcrR family transcriptional regulator [Dietzia sp.]|uniref:TetR/AcrR family transcriptional regulator n=1 Tax=Dietzia sp. TaxID=1871616 RepID=UPI002FD8E3E1
MSDGMSRAEKKRHTRSLIVAAGREKVASSGYSALAVRDTARAAGISATGFYRHFETVEDLAVVIAEGTAEMLSRTVSELIAEDPILEMWPEIIVAAGHSDPEEWPALMHGVLDADHAANGVVGAAMEDAHRRIAITLSRMPELAGRTADDVDALADVVLYDLIRTAIAAARGDRDADVDCRNRLSAILR